jgi:hypothetical protein
MGRGDNFSYEGLRALFDYLEQYEEETNTPIELDVIALCCEYNEDALNDVLENYSLESLEALQANTHVINYDEETGLVLYQIF